MTPFEQQILNLIQDAFPLVERPYAAIAEMLNELAANGDGLNNAGEKCTSPISEQVVFDAVEKLRSSGVIRRIGGVYDSKRLGFISRLCAGKVSVSLLDFSAEPHEQTAMEKFAAAANEVPAITHNYIRSHEYNVWFTVIAENETEIQAIVDKLCATTDLHDAHVMSATQKFKINTVMKGAAAPVGGWQLAVGCEKNECVTERHSDNRRLEESSKFQKSVISLSASDKSRIRTACDDIPHSLTPFNDWGVSCDELREDLVSKRMRRFGAILRHQEAGFAFNAMVCFRIDDNCEGFVSRDSGSKAGMTLETLISQAGALLASNPHVSHCYERPTFENFPYNVYAMMHANSAEQLDQIIADCVRSLSELQSRPVEYAVLYSLRELKKTSFKFFA